MVTNPGQTLHGIILLLMPSDRDAAVKVCIKGVAMILHLVIVNKFQLANI